MGGSVGMMRGGEQEPARALRGAPTEGERALRQLLRKRRIAGHRFRRQVAIGPFIADFACLERRVIIEVDGSSHRAATGKNVICTSASRCRTTAQCAASR